MSPVRPCLGCGRLTSSGSRCPACSRGHHHPAYDSPSYRRARTIVKRRDRVCRALVNGRLCGSKKGLQVHHLDKVRDGVPVHDPARMVLLCGEHHPVAERDSSALSLAPGSLRVDVA